MRTKYFISVFLVPIRDNLRENFRGLKLVWYYLGRQFKWLQSIIKRIGIHFIHRSSPSSCSCAGAAEQKTAGAAVESWRNLTSAMRFRQTNQLRPRLPELESRPEAGAAPRTWLTSRSRHALGLSGSSAPAADCRIYIVMFLLLSFVSAISSWAKLAASPTYR